MEDLSTQQIVKLLKNNLIFKGSNIFDQLEDEDLKKILKIIHISQVEPGSTILKNGEKGDFIVLILEGMVNVYVKDKKGNEISIATELDGSFVGEMAVIDNTIRNSTVKATTNCLLGIIHSEDFWDFFQKHSILAKNIVKEMNVRIKDIRSNFIQRLVREREAADKFSKELEKQVTVKTAQLRIKDLKLIEMDRIAGTATLAAGVAHEINNPLGFVNSTVYLVKKSVDKMLKTVKLWEEKPVPEPLLKEYKAFFTEMNSDNVIKSLDEKFKRIKKGTDRIMQIVNNLKSFSRVDMEVIGKIDINKSIEETIEVLRSQELQNVTFEKEFQEIPLMETFANEIHQCLLHLIKNAADAVENDGIINIKSSYNKQNDQIIVTVVDNGTGMSPEVLRQAMNPFFTTKPVGSGTGVGLSATEMIVRRHGGKIDLSSTEGEGTTVILTLPKISRMVREQK